MGDYARTVRRLRNLFPTLPHDAWVVLAGHGVSAVGTGLTLPFLLVYLNQVRDLDVGVAGLASPIGARLPGRQPARRSARDRVGPRTTVVLGLVLSAAGDGVARLDRPVWHAFAAAALVGLGACGDLAGGGFALASGRRRRTARSHVFAVRFAMLNAGFGVGGLAAAIFVDVDSPGTFMRHLPARRRSVPSLRADPPTLPSRSRRSGAAEGGAAAAGGFRAVLRDKVFLRVWPLTALLVTVGYGQYHSPFPAYATRSGGISARALGLVFAANTITVVLAQLVVLRLLGRHGATRALWLRLRHVGGDLGSDARSRRTRRRRGRHGVFALAMILFAIGETLLPPSLPAIVNELATDELRGRYNGAYTLAWTTGFIVGPVTAGIAIGAGMGTGLFVGLVAACALAAVGAIRLERVLPGRGQRRTAGRSIVTAADALAEVARRRAAADYRGARDVAVTSVGAIGDERSADAAALLVELGRLQEELGAYDDAEATLARAVDVAGSVPGSTGRVLGRAGARPGRGVAPQPGPAPGRRGRGTTGARGRRRRPGCPAGDAGRSAGRGGPGRRTRGGPRRDGGAP